MTELEKIRAEREAWHCSQPACEKPLKEHLVTLASFNERERAAGG